MERLLLCGIDTMLGGNLALALSEHCQVRGLYHQWAVEADTLETAFWHADDPYTVQTHLDEFRPQWIVHCGALGACGWDAAPDEGASAREAATVAHLAELATRHACRLLLLSSDVIFRGPRMFHHEESTAANPTIWAQHVRSMERAAGPAALVLRTHAYGWNFTPAAPGFAETAWHALGSGTPLVADGHRHATPILSGDLAALIHKACDLRLHGLYHLTGAERTSPWRFACELAAARGAALPTQSPVEGHALATDETSLSSQRIRRVLGMATPNLREGLDRFADQATSGWRDRLRCLGRVGLQYAAA